MSLSPVVRRVIPSIPKRWPLFSMPFSPYYNDYGLSSRGPEGGRARSAVPGLAGSRNRSHQERPGDGGGVSGFGHAVVLAVGWNVVAFPRQLRTES